MLLAGRGRCRNQLAAANDSAQGVDRLTIRRSVVSDQDRVSILTRRFVGPTVARRSRAMNQPLSIGPSPRIILVTVNGDRVGDWIRWWRGVEPADRTGRDQISRGTIRMGSDGTLSDGDSSAGIVSLLDTLEQVPGNGARTPHVDRIDAIGQFDHGRVGGDDRLAGGWNEQIGVRIVFANSNANGFYAKQFGGSNRPRFDCRTTANDQSRVSRAAIEHAAGKKPTDVTMQLTIVTQATADSGNDFQLAEQVFQFAKGENLSHDSPMALQPRDCQSILSCQFEQRSVPLRIR